jgi:predicted O-linked N-acetylglucosamine transferase (SPINDLY family)
MDVDTVVPRLLNLLSQPNLGQLASEPLHIPSFQYDSPSAAPASTALCELLNQAVAALEAEEVYCEIGCQKGEYLIAALKNHPQVLAYAVESPDRVDDQGDTVDHLVENLSAAGLSDRVYFCCQDTETFFADWLETGLTDRIGVYFYNGATDYRSQLLALLQVKPFLAERALLIIGQADLGTVRQATHDFLVAEPQAKLLFDLSQSQADLGVLLLDWDITRSEVLGGSNATLVALQDSSTVKAIAALTEQEQATNLNELSQTAAYYVSEGRMAEAERLYHILLQYNPVSASNWQNLGTLYYLLARKEEALDALDRSIQLNPNVALSHRVRGLVLEQLGQWQEAAAAYQQAIALNPDDSETLVNLGDLWVRQGNGQDAEETFRRVIEIVPGKPQGYVRLGDVLVNREDWEGAIEVYRKAANLNIMGAEPWEKLVPVYEKVGDSRRATLCRIYSLYAQHRHEEAIEQFQARFTIDQIDTFNQCLVIQDCYSQCGFTERAKECAQQIARLRPDDAFLQIAPQLVLPLFYNTSEEITEYRKRYLAGYTTLQQQVEQAAAREEPINFHVLGNFTNFYITYQGYNDRDIHAIHGNLRQRLMREGYPQFTQSLPMPAPLPNGKIRIGYIAEALGNNSETRWAIGWLKNHDRSKFEIYCYSINSDDDIRTEQFRLFCDVFVHLPNDLEAICQKIRSDNLHILVYLALGTRVKSLTVASLRLAPVQCSAWGHPVTSGLRTIDYFLSGELMEPLNGQDHYTEKLVRLPNLGVCYPCPQFPPPNRTRADLGLREDAVIYLSCQLLFKYLPQHDYLFVEIARRVPQAQIVFVLRSTFNNRSNPSLERAFQQRLGRAFSQAGLVMEDHCVFLPGQDMQGYAGLLTETDVFLDTLSFSGGHTTFDAIAFQVPVVCCPGEFMRGRQSYAALRMMGVTETIAYNESEYIDIAVRLGLEPEWRAALVQRMGDHQNQLFEDTECVSGLEEFYRQVVENQSWETENQPEIPESPLFPPTQTVLHVGCGPYNPTALPEIFQTNAWRELRLDINPAVNPDVIGSITDMGAVSDESVNAIFSSHNLEHVYAHEVPLVLAEFYRVLKPGGMVMINVPDIQKVAEHVAQGNLEGPLFVSQVGEITAIDILFGLRTALAEGNSFMAHRTAFTADTLSQKLHNAGFHKITIEKQAFNLNSVAYKPDSGQAADSASNSAIDPVILRQQTVQAVVDGRLEVALQGYRALLKDDGKNVELWQNLGMVYYLMGLNTNAVDAMETATEMAPDCALSHQIKGLALERLEQPDAAIAAYQRAITLDPAYLDALNSLGDLLLRRQELLQAETVLRQAIALAPTDFTAHFNLGKVLAGLKRWQEAIAVYQQASQLKRRDLELWQHLAEAYRAVGDFSAADLCVVYSLYFQEQHEQAVGFFQTHLTFADLKISSDCLLLYDCFAHCGLTQQCIECAKAFAHLYPDDAFLQGLPDLVLPILYQSSTEIAESHQRYRAGYQRLLLEVEQGHLQEKPVRFRALELFTNFYFCYQAQNDLETYEISGRLRHQLMAEQFPQWAKSLTMPAIAGNGKIRIGYIAASLGNNSATRWAAGWLQNHDRSLFEIYCYNLDAESDQHTQQFRLLSDRFYHLPKDVDQIGNRIRSDNLHILVYLAVGTQSFLTNVAALRLAPVQCSAWGHPVTTGLPTIDYFLSSERMEPEQGQEHYTETLVRLPNLGICYPKPALPQPVKTRSDFGLREDTPVYLSCQLLPKYLPQHDHLFSAIARQLPTAQLVFVLRSTRNNHSNPNLERMFQQRLRRAFAEVGLEMEKHCVFLPGQDMPGYASLLNSSDVFLDTPDFSGGHTVFDAIAACLPIVSLPGTLMRGRQSTAALQMLNVTETIAATEAEYVDIAVRLGREPEWRQAIARKMGENHGNLFEDKTCVAGLEAFYREVVRHHQLS